MKWLELVFMNNQVKNYLVAVGVAFAGLFIAWIISALIKSKVIKDFKKSKNRIDDVLAGVGAPLIFWIIFLAGLHASTKVLTLPEWLQRVLWVVFLAAWTVLGALFVSRLLNGVMVHYVQHYTDNQLVPALKSAVSITVWVIAGLFALSNLGFNVNSILAGLGLGGLALAMASKDLLANVFGAFTILFQGPFQVGDTVTYQDRTGVVEEVGIRATRIRTFEGHLVTVPNAVAPTSVVVNVSKRPSFKVMFNLRLKYDTSLEKCDKISELIHAAIRAQKGTSEKIDIYFIEFSSSALVYQIVYFIEDQDHILDICHQVNRKIKKAIEQAEVLLA